MFAVFAAVLLWRPQGLFGTARGGIARGGYRIPKEAVAIVALMFFNYLQTRVGALAAVYARSCERFVQALIFVEASSEAEEADGQLVPAR